MSLSPAFCLHNGVVILDQHSGGISFGVVNIDDKALCLRLEKSFYRFNRENGNAAHDSVVHFIKIDKDMCARSVSKLFAADSENDGGVMNRLTAQIRDEKNTRDEAPAVTLLDSLINDALRQEATDIHLEGQRVRFRICGKLKEHIVFKRETAESLALRIKNLAKLNTLEKRRPQDGQFSFDKNACVVSIRVSCVPSLTGESIVLRLLDPSRIPLVPEKLGFTERQISLIYSLLKNDDGLILVCGPTGSGKSTTLASLLTYLQNNSGNAKKIVTIEDPVEYLLDGITQIQINTGISLDFDELLRRVFRQDPDVIMLGEIRDRKTAAVSASAALTGHLVFATLHTSGKDEAVTRLKDLGIDEKLVTAVLRGVISQRLIEVNSALKLEGDVAVFKGESHE
jgi:type II secretory ATPase GspE/PulE/Tfp pilus assembly ATPase PilB-like protein